MSIPRVTAKTHAAEDLGRAELKAAAARDLVHRAQARSRAAQAAATAQTQQTRPAPH
jgi:hypothetical protein